MRECGVARGDCGLGRAYNDRFIKGGFMRRRGIVVAAGFVLAAAWPPSQQALAQEGEQGGADRGRARDRDRDQDRDQGDPDRDDRDRGDRDRGDRDGRGPANPLVRSVSPRAGAAGTQVTVRGRFPDGTRVLFGGVEVPLTRADGRSITFAVPAMPGGSRAIVLRAGGSDVAAGEFRVERPPAGVPPPLPAHKARWDRVGWVLLGEQLVQGKRDRDVIAVAPREGKFTNLMVVVEDGDLQMSSMAVVFGNGEVFNPALKHFFREDDRTRGIDLPGDRRAIQRIEFRYGNLPGGDRARVQVWARDSAPRAGGGGNGAPPPPVASGEPYPRGMSLVTDFWPRRGPAGTVVTIMGRHFTPEIQIVFGDQVVAPSRRDETLLTFVAPRQRGAAAIVLRRPGRRDLPVGMFEGSVSGRDGERERDHWRDERRKAAESWWLQRQHKLAASEAERDVALRAEEARLARERDERRKQRRAGLRARWEQQLLTQEDVRAELALHADRTARLQRMLRLAEAERLGRLAVRVRLLIDYEDARSQQRMDDLKMAYARR